MCLAYQSGKKTIISTLGNEIDITPYLKHTSVNKNPGPYGEVKIGGHIRRRGKYKN